MITGPMRTGRKLGQTPGLTTLYIEAPGEDWEQDRCVGMTESPEIAAAIAGAVNAQYGFTPRPVTQSRDRRSALIERIGTLWRGDWSGHRFDGRDGERWLTTAVYGDEAGLAELEAELARVEES